MSKYIYIIYEQREQGDVLGMSNMAAFSTYKAARERMDEWAESVIRHRIEDDADINDTNTFRAFYTHTNQGNKKLERGNKITLDTYRFVYRLHSTCEEGIIYDYDYNMAIVKTLVY